MSTGTPLPSRLSWSAIRGSYAANVGEHQCRAQALGLDCPEDVFEQLFHDAHQDTELAQLLRFIDWKRVTWEEGELSGVALRRVGVPRAFQHAADEARLHTAEEGFSDERPEVMVHWMQEHTSARRSL